jgi:hypothetical protein
MPTPLSSTVSRLSVDQERDARLRIAPEQGWIRDRLEAEPLAGVGGVGDQLAQENVPIRVDRVHHELKQLGDVSFETAALRGDGVG